MSILKLVLKYISCIAYDVFDACPPYRYAEGLLEGKESLGPDEKHVIFVASCKVEVDEHTFDNLMIGEHVRVRSTRSGRAINIDRMVPGQGPI